MFFFFVFFFFWGGGGGGGCIWIRCGWVCGQWQVRWSFVTWAQIIYENIFPGVEILLIKTRQSSDCFIFYWKSLLWWDGNFILKQSPKGEGLLRSMPRPIFVYTNVLTWPTDCLAAVLLVRQKPGLNILVDCLYGLRSNRASSVSFNISAQSS